LRLFGVAGMFSVPIPCCVFANSSWLSLSVLVLSEGHHQPCPS
jgi:hypothetical protein